MITIHYQRCVAYSVAFVYTT